jgi:hypothetical protein
MVGSPHAIHCLQHQCEREGEFELDDDDDWRLARADSDDIASTNLAFGFEPLALEEAFGRRVE